MLLVIAWACFVLNVLMAALALWVNDSNALRESAVLAGAWLVVALRQHRIRELERKG